MMDSPFGYCPTCGATGVSRASGADTCSAGHAYPTDKAVYGKAHATPVGARTPHPKVDTGWGKPQAPTGQQGRRRGVQPPADAPGVSGGHGVPQFAEASANAALAANTQQPQQQQPVAQQPPQPTAGTGFMQAQDAPSLPCMAVEEPQRVVTPDLYRDALNKTLRTVESLLTNLAQWGQIPAPLLEDSWSKVEEAGFALEKLPVTFEPVEPVTEPVEKEQSSDEPS